MNLSSSIIQQHLFKILLDHSSTSENKLEKKSKLPFDKICQDTSLQGEPHRHVATGGDERKANYLLTKFVKTPRCKVNLVGTWRQVAMKEKQITFDKICQDTSLQGEPIAQTIG
jgi:hypothetical protein